MFDTERLAGIDHILRIAPQRRAGTLPGITAIKQQRARTTGLCTLDQRRQVGKTADLAVGLGSLFEIQEGEGMGIDRVRLESEMLEEGIADQMRHLAVLIAEAKVNVRLAEVDRQQLGMAVRNMQQIDITEFGQVVHRGRALFRQCKFAVQGHATSRRNRQHLEKLSTIHAHG